MISNLVWAALVVLAAVWVIRRFRRRSTASRQTPGDTYLCPDCNERDCDCRKDG